MSEELKLLTAGSTDELHLCQRDRRGSKVVDLLPPLYEPQMAAIGSEAIMLRSYESCDGAAFVQEWHCIV